MIVNVLQEDIDAKCSQPRGCAVSRALQREFPDLIFGVTQTEIDVYKSVGDREEQLYRLPVDLNDWINAHDKWVHWQITKEANTNGQYTFWLRTNSEPPKPQPFEFELEIPWQTWNRNRLVQVLAFAKTMTHYDYKWSGCIFGQYCDNNKLGLKRNVNGFEEMAPCYEGENGTAAVHLFLGVSLQDATHLVGAAAAPEFKFVNNLQEHIERIEKFLANN